MRQSSGSWRDAGEDEPLALHLGRVGVRWCEHVGGGGFRGGTPSPSA
jgi:hypothetical protein